MQQRFPRVYQIQREAWDMTKDGQATLWYRLWWRAVKLLFNYSSPMLRMREKALFPPEVLPS